MPDPVTSPAIPEPRNVAREFGEHWLKTTDDNNLTLHGFRRFKTTHLLNLRFLESEIAELDRVIYQAGLTLNLKPSATDRLGLKHSRRDEKVPKISESINPELVSKLRDLLKQYGTSSSHFKLSELTQYD